MGSCSPIVRLEKAHARTNFDSGAADLDEWLVKYAWQNQRANNATTFVTLCGQSVGGYYALAVTTVAKEQAPDSLAKNSPTQIGCLLLARLAVDRSCQGQGVATALLRDCLIRAVRLSQEMGIKALLVHCRDDAAKSFYLSRAEFLQSPVEEMHLLLPMAPLQRKLQSGHLL